MIGMKVAIHENDAARGHAPPIMRRTGLGAILIAGLALRAAVIAFTGGTSDLWLWDMFASAIDQYGLAAYAHVERLNHPPLGAFLVWALYKLGPLGITLRAKLSICPITKACGRPKLNMQVRWVN